MNSLLLPAVRTCASVRARILAGGAPRLRKLGMLAFAFYLIKGLAWLAIGMMAFGR